MTFRLYFSSSSKVWDSIDWVFGIEECGYAGWEIVADGSYRLDNKDNKKRIDDVVSSTGLGITVHAPYGDLNLATLNYPIWKESIRQICTCIEESSKWTDRVTIHPGYLSPVGKMMPEKAWEQQKTALKEIGRCAMEYSVTACLENMISLREFLCRVPGELVGMTEGIEGVGITIDIGHAHTMGKVEEFLPLLPMANHVHIHDNHGMSDEHLALGEGTINWDIVGTQLARDYHGIAVVEGRSLKEGKLSLRVVKGWLE
ncbi:MAG TPA: sugar phosphate isomerase/epimerase family protein [Methanoregulaceae archaeon]|nr:sugar phosphate isomerase/epimerase family protein [Methanoregulaceae archaeon]